MIFFQIYNKMCFFKKYRFLFGKEKQGIHKYRFNNIAIIDLIGTFIISIILSYFFKINFLISFSIMILLGILLHFLFGVETTFNLYLYNLINNNKKYI